MPTSSDRAKRDRRLTVRELNRSTLARQLLLQRQKLTVPGAVARVAGLQAERPNAPYVGLWTRIHNARLDDVRQSLGDREVVRAPLMRSTLHLLTAADYVALRPALQPALTRALTALYGKRATALDVARLVSVARPYLAEQPRTAAELREFLAKRYPEHDAAAMTYAVRTHLPIVQVPAMTGWGYSTTSPLALADDWLGKAIPATAAPDEVIRRYLAAFGPATTQDLQQWSGLVRLRDVVSAMHPELRSFQDEQDRALVDLPEMPLPAADTPMPPRFLPELDNLLLAHADRTRVIPDAYRSAVFLSAGRVKATVLLDGFVQGTWRIERDKAVNRLLIELFAPASKRDRDDLHDEGGRLLRFLETDTTSVDIRIDTTT